MEEIYILKNYFFFATFFSSYISFDIFVQKWRNCWRTLLYVLVSLGVQPIFFYLFLSSSTFRFLFFFFLIHSVSVMIFVISFSPSLVVIFVMHIESYFWWPSIWYTDLPIDELIFLFIRLLHLMWGEKKFVSFATSGRVRIANEWSKNAKINKELYNIVIFLLLLLLCNEDDVMFINWNQLFLTFFL